MLSRTFMGALAVPRDYQLPAREYIDWLCTYMLPLVRRRELASFADLLCDGERFSLDDVRRYLDTARNLGFRLKMYQGSYRNHEAVRLGVERGVTSVGYSVQLDAKDFETLATSQTIATLLPAETFNLGLQDYPAARKLIDYGAAVALATNYNPETNPSCNMQVFLSLACSRMKMTPGEAITAATINGAHALGLQSKVGSLEVGKQADLIILDVPDYRELPYHFGVNASTHNHEKRSRNLSGIRGQVGLRQIVECVPNFSEGRDAEIVGAIRNAIAGTPGVMLLRAERDTDHNRSVMTFAGDPEAVLDAAFHAIRQAAETIDLTQHAGEHPRIGAADVVPLVPVEGVTLAECAALAHRLGDRVWSELGVPVYFYEAAALRETNVNLESVRRGGFERPCLLPDLGGPACTRPPEPASLERENS